VERGFRWDRCRSHHNGVTQSKQIRDTLVITAVPHYVIAYQYSWTTIGRKYTGNIFRNLLCHILKTFLPLSIAIYDFTIFKESACWSYVLVNVVFPHWLWPAIIILLQLGIWIKSCCRNRTQTDCERFWESNTLWIHINDANTFYSFPHYFIDCLRQHRNGLQTCSWLWSIGLLITLVIE